MTRYYYSLVEGTYVVRQSRSKHGAENLTPEGEWIDYPDLRDVITNGRPIESEEEHEFYDSYVHSPRNAAHRLRKKFSNLEKRIRRMEDTVTGKEYEWEKKFNS